MRVWYDSLFRIDICDWFMPCYRCGALSDHWIYIYFTMFLIDSIGDPTLMNCTLSCHSVSNTSSPYNLCACPILTNMYSLCCRTILFWLIYHCTRKMSLFWPTFCNFGLRGDVVVHMIASLWVSSIGVRSQSLVLLPGLPIIFLLRLLILTLAADCMNFVFSFIMWARPACARQQHLNP